VVQSSIAMYRKPNPVLFPTTIHANPRLADMELVVVRTPTAPTCWYRESKKIGMERKLWRIAAAIMQGRELILNCASRYIQPFHLHGFFLGGKQHRRPSNKVAEVVRCQVGTPFLVQPDRYLLGARGLMVFPLLLHQNEEFPCLDSIKNRRAAGRSRYVSIVYPQLPLPPDRTFRHIEKHQSMKRDRGFTQ
jgi:hypothetical protein